MAQLPSQLGVAMGLSVSFTPSGLCLAGDGPRPGEVTVERRPDPQGPGGVGLLC